MDQDLLAVHVNLGEVEYPRRPWKLDRNVASHARTRRAHFYSACACSHLRASSVWLGTPSCRGWPNPDLEGSQPILATIDAIVDREATDRLRRAQINLKPRVVSVRIGRCAEVRVAVIDAICSAVDSQRVADHGSSDSVEQLC